MTLTNRRYKSIDAVRLAFQISPVYAALHVLLSVVHVLMPTIATALTTAYFIDTATAILQGRQPFHDIYLALALLLLVLGVFMTIGSVIQLVASRMNLDLERELKAAVVEKNSKLDYKHIENAESWERISRVTRDPANSIMEGFRAYLSFLQIVISVSSVLVLIVAQAWWAALIILAFSVPMFWLSMRAGKKTYQAGRDAERFNRRTDYLGEVLTGRDAVEERTLFDYGAEINRHWREQFEAGFALVFKVSFKQSLIAKGSASLLVLIGLLVALTLIGPVINGLMSAGMFMGLVSTVFGVIQQLSWQMSSSLENISKVGEYLKDLTEFVSLSETEGACDLPDAEPIAFTSLEFRNVRFKYPTGRHYILDGLSFTLTGGRHYAFVGKNGAGKTTIIKLLTGLYEEYEGEILLNGRELRQYPASTRKALFSVAYQDFAKYSIPFKDNILLGDAAADDAAERIWESSRQAGLADTIAGLKKGIDTPLGKVKSEGQDLSGGQWQRIAIARSLISRAPVKILDEPTAALDPLSESRMYEEYEQMMRGKTTVLISHRLGSTKLADEILVIDDGKIIERGKHSELMQINGQYCEMFEVQRGWYQ